MFYPWILYWKLTLKYITHNIMMALQIFCSIVSSNSAPGKF